MFEKWITFVHGMLMGCASGFRPATNIHRVGGVVAETSFKFFIQFVSYTAVFCTFTLIVSAYFLAELKRRVSPVHVSMIAITCFDNAN